MRIGLALALLAALLLAGCSAAQPPTAPTPTPTPGSAPTPRTVEFITVRPQDQVQAIDEPTFYAAAAADAEYSPYEAVVGVSLGGEQRAYSMDVLDLHEVVNDVVGGRRIAVTRSPLTFAAVVYDRELAGRELTFGVSGKLIMNASALYDRQTNSSWSQITGQAVEGPLSGSVLAYVPSQQTRWSDWKARYPDTRALVKGSRGMMSPYVTYYRSREDVATGRTQLDNRLQVRELVLGVTAGTGAAAYSYSALRRQPVANDQVGDEPALVVFRAETGLGTAFSRRLADGRVLTFTGREGAVLADKETGSEWSGLDGRATRGPLAGTQLAQLKSTWIYWFAWVDWYPDTQLFEPAQ